MSLYDDIDENKAKAVTGWSSGIKLMQSQLQLKKAMVTQVNFFICSLDQDYHPEMSNIYFVSFSQKERR